jgi:hypothetical protein
MNCSVVNDAETRNWTGIKYACFERGTMGGSRAGKPQRTFTNEAGNPVKIQKIHPKCRSKSFMCSVTREGFLNSPVTVFFFFYTPKHLERICRPNNLLFNSHRRLFFWGGGGGGREGAEA